MNQIKQFIVPLLSILLITFVACSRSNTVSTNDELNIIGAYNGSYILTNIDGNVLVNVNIDMIYKDSTYELNDTTRTICSPRGEYRINGDTINLDEIYYDGKTVCDPEKNPTGEFTFRYIGDSLILNQTRDSVYSEILLVKKP